MAQQIGTPDWQRGVVSAQKLLGSWAGTVQGATVGVPPNAETLVIILTGVPTGAVPTVTGVTTGFAYQVTLLPVGGAMSGGQEMVASVSDALDDQVNIYWPAGAPGNTWYSYSDNAVHTVADTTLRAMQVSPGGLAGNVSVLVSGQDSSSPDPLARILLTDTSGRLRVVPGTDGTTEHQLATDASGHLLDYPGSDGTNPHPLLTDSAGRLVVTEIGNNAAVTGVFNNGSVVLAAPAAGYVNRIYSCSAIVSTVPEIVHVVGQSTNAIYAIVNCSTSGVPATSGYLGPIQAGEGLLVFDSLNSQSITLTVLYRQLPVT